MTDTTTEKPLQVRDGGETGPYITVLVSQLADLTRLLDSHGVRYEVDSLAISLNGEPSVTEVRFGRRGNAAAVQRILDGVS